MQITDKTKGYTAFLPIKAQIPPLSKNRRNEDRCQDKKRTVSTLEREERNVFFC